MKISDKILSIPPYISSSWKNIASIQVEPRPFGHVLLIELVTGTKVEIPNLDRVIIEKVFESHAQVVENEGSRHITFPPLERITSMIQPITQHTPEQKDSPPLPPEMLEKIAEMTKGLIPEDGSSMQQPEPDCNCPHCQIMRAVLGTTNEPAILIEEEVTDEDLKFRSWDIKQESDKLYTVTNPLDLKEHYTVFLGDPIGCTCGSKNCEHIQAVLKS